MEVDIIRVAYEDCGNRVYPIFLVNDNGSKSWFDEEQLAMYVQEKISYNGNR